MLKLLYFLVILGAILGGEAYAENFSGKYAASRQGSKLTLSLKQDQVGNIFGTLDENEITRFQLEGAVQDGGAVGICRGITGDDAFFDAQFHGKQLMFNLIQPGGNNFNEADQPNQLVFTRQKEAESINSAIQSPSQTSKPLKQEAEPPAWGFKINAPVGWNMGKGTQGAIFSHDTIPGIILLINHQAKDLNDMQSHMETGLSENEIQLELKNELKNLAHNILAGNYSGLYQGGQVTAYGLGSISPYGGGVYIIAMSKPDQFSPQLSTAAEALAQGIKYLKADPPDLVRYFSGNWTTPGQNSRMVITLNPNGEFLEGVVNTPGKQTDTQSGDQTGYWGTESVNQQKGRWTVQGDRQEGTLNLIFENGSQTALPYRVHTEQDLIYWGEYWFNNRLYNKQK